MKTLAAFQLLVGLGVLLSVWALGPFALSTRSFAVFILLTVALLTGPTLLLLGSVLVLFSKARGFAGACVLVGSLLSSAWLLYIVGNIVFGQPNRPLNKWETEVALVLVLLVATSSAAAICLYRIAHGVRPTAP